MLCNMSIRAYRPYGRSQHPPGLTNNAGVYRCHRLSKPIPHPRLARLSSPAATIYVRLPTSLKTQFEAIAANEKLSVNAVAIRCMERCIADRMGITGMQHADGRVVAGTGMQPFRLAEIGRALGRPQESDEQAANRC